jgi:hypothetical protein
LAPSFLLTLQTSHIHSDWFSVFTPLCIAAASSYGSACYCVAIVAAGEKSSNKRDCRSRSRSSSSEYRGPGACRFRRFAPLIGFRVTRDASHFQSTTASVSLSVLS